MMVFTLLSVSYLCWQNAKHDEAWMILKQIHDTNWRAKGQPEKVFTVSTCSLANMDITVQISVRYDELGSEKSSYACSMLSVVMFRFWNQVILTRNMLYQQRCEMLA